MGSWAEISGRSLSCRPGARWELEQVSFFISEILKDHFDLQYVCHWGSMCTRVIPSFMVFHVFSRPTKHSPQSIKRTVRPPSMVPLYKAQKVRCREKHVVPGLWTVLMKKHLIWRQRHWNKLHSQDDLTWDQLELERVHLQLAHQEVFKWKTFVTSSIDGLLC